MQIVIFNPTGTLIFKILQEAVKKKRLLVQALPQLQLIYFVCKCFHSSPLMPSTLGLSFHSVVSLPASATAHFSNDVNVKLN